MIEINFDGARGLQNIQKVIAGFREENTKALDTSIRVEGYRMMRLLQKQIKAGAPGGIKFAPLSFMRRMQYGGRNRPLRESFNAVRYQAYGSPISMVRVGFIPQFMVSDSWIRIVEKHQRGFTTPTNSVSSRGILSVRLARIGAAMKRAGDRKAKYFFLRRTTTALRTPARPIIDPFWHSEKDNALKNIRENFRRKLRGERI